MQKLKNSFPLFLVMVSILFLTASGCALLTKSQVKEVEKFAKASKSYNELPGTLAQAYGELLRNSKLLIIARKEFGHVEKGKIDTTEANEAWDTMLKAYKDETDFEAAGKRMDAALSVLNLYSDMLTAIVADDFNDALGDSAEQLGKSLDDATEEYSEKYRPDKPLKRVGGTIAMAIRSAGGLYIRRKQTSILMTTLEEANPLVADLMNEVKLISSEKFKPSLINFENNYLQNDFKSLLNNKKQVDVSAVSFVYNSLYKTRQLIILADRIAHAADTYKKAHADLVENTRTKKTIKETIKQIEALSEEVNDANKVKKEVNK